MRITEFDLQCEDIMWFGIDSFGNIFECTSAGRGNVPEYVCKSREETDKLLEFFTETLSKTTTPILLIPEEDNELVDDVKDLSSKGIYCYDLTDYDNDNVYNCIAKPTVPINIKDLPSDIQTILSDHIYSGNIPESASITVEHAY